MEMFSYKESLLPSPVSAVTVQYNVRLFDKIVGYKTWQWEGHHSIEVYGAGHT